MHNRKIKKCDVKSCTTSRKGLQRQRLCSLPLKNIDSDLKQKVIDHFEINGNEKACRKCRTSVSAFIRTHENEPKTCRTAAETTKPVTYGRPRVSYSDASSATKRRMKSTVRGLVQGVVEKCDEISKDDGWKILKDVTKNTPLQDSAKEDIYRKKISKVMHSVSETFQKEARGPSGKIRVLSTLAPHFKNKELKKAIPCTDYQ